jgi:hypothetical protein
MANLSLADIAAITGSFAAVAALLWYIFVYRKEHGKLIIIGRAIHEQRPSLVQFIGEPTEYYQADELEFKVINTGKHNIEIDEIAVIRGSSRF